MSRPWRNRLIGIGIALTIFAVDQWVKKLVTGTLGIDALGDYLEILPFFDLRFTQNFGVSLGMFSATSMEMRWMLVAVTALLGAVVGRFARTRIWLAIVVFGLFGALAAGATISIGESTLGTVIGAGAAVLAGLTILTWLYGRIERDMSGGEGAQDPSRRAFVAGAGASGPGPPP